MNWWTIWRRGKPREKPDEKGARNVPKGAKDVKAKGQKPASDKKPAVKGEEVKLVRNDSRIDQHVGQTVLLTGRESLLDVSPGSVGRALIDKGVLSLVGERKRREPPKVQAALPEVGLFKCPWCGTDFNVPDLAQQHIVGQHADEILAQYAEMVRTLTT